MPKAKIKDIEEQNPQLYRPRCPICGKVAEVEIPEGASWLCCSEWWKAKSPETLEAEKKARFKMPEKQKVLVDRYKESRSKKRRKIKRNDTNSTAEGLDKEA